MCGAWCSVVLLVLDQINEVHSPASNMSACVHIVGKLMMCGPSLGIRVVGNMNLSLMNDFMISVVYIRIYIYIYVKLACVNW